MSRSILFAVAIMSAFAMGSANAADPAPASESDQLHAACSKLGYSPGEAQFDQCLTILKDTMAQMHHSRMGKMINDACGAAGFTAGTPQYASCVQRLTATLEADERNNG